MEVRRLGPADRTGRSGTEQADGEGSGTIAAERTDPQLSAVGHVRTAALARRADGGSAGGVNRGDAETSVARGARGKGRTLRITEHRDRDHRGPPPLAWGTDETRRCAVTRACRTSPAEANELRATRPGHGPRVPSHVDSPDGTGGWSPGRRAVAVWGAHTHAERPGG